MNQTEEFKKIIDSAKRIVIVQADNPDGDSLASSLALEEILGDIGKEVSLFCGVEIPSYLRYMTGWDRINTELPRDFDASIIVDTSAISLLETLDKTGELSWLKTKPCVVIDHHQSTDAIDFVSLTINEPAVATCEVIYDLAESLGYTLSLQAAEFIAYGILSDSLGLTSEAVNPHTFLIFSKLAEKGVNMAKLDNTRRALSKKSPRILAYKGQLLQRVTYSQDSRIAIVHIPWDEIETYSYEYNPSMLALDEMRMVEGVEVAIAFKTYPDGKITAKIRCNYGSTIASDLAQHFNGGGHAYAAGFKLQDRRPLREVQAECIDVATKLLDKIKEG